MEVAEKAGELNNIEQLALSNTLHVFYGDESVANPYLDVKLTSNYYDSDGFITSFKNAKNPIFMSINIQSLISKKQALNDIINDYVSNCVPIEIIAIQEVWKIPHIEVVQIPNFAFVRESRISGKGGGVGFYVHDSIKFKVIRELSLFVENTFESITIEIKKIPLANSPK